MELKPGFRFVPSDDGLVASLCEKVYGGGQARSDRVVLVECDIYGDKEPWQIWDENGGLRVNIKACEDLYLFTKLKKVSVNGSNFNRQVGSGKWSGANSVDVAGGLAKKRHFTYENIGCRMHHNAWIMHEYSLVDSRAEYVLCRLRKKVKKNIKKIKHAKFVNDEENNQELIKNQRIGVESECNRDPITMQSQSHGEEQHYLPNKTNNYQILSEEHRTCGADPYVLCQPQGKIKGQKRKLTNFTHDYSCSSPSTSAVGDDHQQGIKKQRVVDHVHVDAVDGNRRSHGGGVLEFQSEDVIDFGFFFLFC